MRFAFYAILASVVGAPDTIAERAARAALETPSAPASPETTPGPAVDRPMNLRSVRHDASRSVTHRRSGW